MRLLICNSPAVRAVWLIIISASWTMIQSLPANALIVENMAGTTVAPADDPGWNFVTERGLQYTYLGDGWVLSALHTHSVSPTGNENVHFASGSYKMIKNQGYTVKNPAGSGFSTNTDLRLIRITGDLGTPTFSLASQPITESTPQLQREVVIIGHGPSRQNYQAQWNVQVVAGNNNDIWTEVFSPEVGTHKGFRAVNPDDDVKRWGTNLIADEDCLFNTNCSNDADLRGKLTLTLGGGLGAHDIQSMVTYFDNPLLSNGSPNPNALPQEAQVVGGDSGSAVFYKRNGQWELVGIVNAKYSNYDNQSTAFAVYGNGVTSGGDYTTFADVSYYRNEILNIMNANPNYSVIGDVNLDGVVNGSTESGIATGDIAAFVAGWGYNNGLGFGTVESWQKGDLNRDGKTDVADFLMLRDALHPAGLGSLTLGSLGVVAVPEPSSLLLVALAGVALMAGRLHRR